MTTIRTTQKPKQTDKKLLTYAQTKVNKTNAWFRGLLTGQQIGSNIQLLRPWKWTLIDMCVWSPSTQSDV